MARVLQPRACEALKRCATLCHVPRGIANAVNEELESLAVQSQAVNMQHADVSKMLDFEGGNKN